MKTQFVWTQQWYPINPLSYLDTDNPIQVTLIRKKLVIWRDKNQKWIAMMFVLISYLDRYSSATDADISSYWSLEFLFIVYVRRSQAAFLSSLSKRGLPLVKLYENKAKK